MHGTGRGADEVLRPGCCGVGAGIVVGGAGRAVSVAELPIAMTRKRQAGDDLAAIHRSDSDDNADAGVRAS